MDRIIVYPGGIPLDTDLLSTNVNTMVAFGALIQAAFGSNVVVDGLAVQPTSPASMSVVVGPGSITQLSPLEQNAYGTLPSDTSDSIVKMGINTGSSSFTLTAPSVAGQSLVVLLEASFQEADANPVVLPYYNAANPAQPYLGPGNSGSAQATSRTQRVQLQMKSGTAAPIGSQVAPPVDAGWTGLATVTLNFGQTAITAANILALPTAPTIPFKLPTLRPGFSTIQPFTASGNFIVPTGVTRLRVRAIGGGGGGAGTDGNQAGGGGGAGGYVEGVFPVTQGQTVAIAVGAGGGAGAVGRNPGITGGTSSFGTLAVATGGQGGQNATNTSAGGCGGQGAGGQINLIGGSGTSGAINANILAGNGGASALGGGGQGSTVAGASISVGQAPGSGGGGAMGAASISGSSGASGIVIIEY